MTKTLTDYQKDNYLLTIFREHQKNPYIIFRLSGCGGCKEIERRLYACMEDDIGLITNVNTHRKTRGRRIDSHPHREEMLMSLCKRINELQKEVVDAMSRCENGKKFYEINSNRDNFLKFIIMYIWDNLSSTLYSLQDRGDRLNYFKDLISNKFVLEVIECMDKRYTKNCLMQKEHA